MSKDTGCADPQPSKKTLGEMIYGVLDIQPDTLPYGTLIEIRGRGSVTLRGCGHVLLYTDSEMRFSCHGGQICIKGRRLLCSSYCRGAAVIDGIIDAITFEEAEK